MTPALYKNGFVFAVIVLFIGTGVVPSFANVIDDNVETEARTNMNESKKWTFMFYDDADFFWAYDPLDDFSEDAFSSQNLNVIVLQDKEYGPANMWYIDENHNTELLEEMGEVNMGDYQTLQDFVDYCKNEYPAERYILALYDHGMGWNGACIDKGSYGDHLTMDEMQKALTKAGGVDILCFSAPCNMGAVESVYELRDCVDVYIGSEEGSGYCYWRDTINSLCETLNENPDISNIALAEKIIQWIEENAKSNGEYEDVLTIGAVRTDNIEGLVASIEEFSIYVYEYFNKSFNNAMTARKNAKKVGGDYYGGIDLLDFVQKYYDIENNQNIRQYLQNITEAFNEVVIKECHGVEHEGDHGLSIYFPITKLFYGYDREYSNCELDFTRDTHWDEFLLKFVEKSKAINTPFLQFLENHPRMFPMLRHLLGL
jgi:hypothetical protein